MLYVFFSASNNWMKEKRFLCVWHHSKKLKQNETKKKEIKREKERQDKKKKKICRSETISFIRYIRFQL